jgi:hypothetical protein
MLHTHVASKNEDMNEMIDANAYEMQCNYGSQTPRVLHSRPDRWAHGRRTGATACPRGIHGLRPVGDDGVQKLRF